MSRGAVDPRGLSRYFDPHFERPTVKLQPGDYYATGGDEVLVTVLGSCVAACLWDPVAQVGGMNHFMLPGATGAVDGDPLYPARYGVQAMELLVNGLLALGAARGRLVAKAFGGGQVMQGLTDVGARNIEFVRGFLAREGIPLWAEDLGGLLPRKVYFVPHAEQVLVKKLQKTHNDTLVLRERDYAARIQAHRSGGDVELFS